MVLIDLAEQGQGKPVSLRSVAERQGISEKYLEGIVARLGAASLVDSIRGKYGGYRLSKKPSEYTIIEILMATEESMAIIYFLSAKIASTNPLNNGCALFGRDFNSGCACVPTKNGWSLTSMLSTRRPSGDVPEITRPASFNC